MLTNPLLTIAIRQQNVYGSDPSMGVHRVGNFRPALCAYPLCSHEVCLRFYFTTPHTLTLFSKLDYLCIGLELPSVPNRDTPTRGHHPRPNMTIRRFESLEGYWDQVYLACKVPPPYLKFPGPVNIVASPRLFGVVILSRFPTNRAAGSCRHK